MSRLTRNIDLKKHHYGTLISLIVILAMLSGIGYLYTESVGKGYNDDVAPTRLSSDKRSEELQRQEYNIKTLGSFSFTLPEDWTEYSELEFENQTDESSKLIARATVKIPVEELESGKDTISHSQPIIEVYEYSDELINAGSTIVYVSMKDTETFEEKTKGTIADYPDGTVLLDRFGDGVEGQSSVETRFYVKKANSVLVVTISMEITGQTDGVKFSSAGELQATDTVLNALKLVKSAN